MPALNPQRAEFYLEHSKVHLSPALPTPSNDLLGADVGGFLVVSPYTCPPHLLDLKPLSDSQRLLARALTVLQPSREDYATASYTEAFNWDAVIGELRALVVSSSYKWKRQRFYIVVFRSQVPATTNRLQLGELDQTSHAEATKSGGLLKYWFGMPDENGRNLATCIWRKHEDARPASIGPGHKAAMRATISMYSEWKIERLRFEVGEGAKGWSIESWED